MKQYNFFHKILHSIGLLFLIFVPIFSIIFRTGLGFCIFAYYYTAGTKYEWLYPLQIGLILGFAPWGWKVESWLKERQEARELDRIRSSYYCYSKTTVEIRQSSILGSLILIIFKLFLNGLLGMVLGWKVFFDMVKEVVWKCNLLIEYIWS